MYGSIAELMANQPDFNRMKIRGGESPYREPVMPGEQRLTPSMQEKLQPALPPVQKAKSFLADYLSTRGGAGEFVVADNLDSTPEEREAASEALRGVFDRQRVLEERMLRAEPAMLRIDPVTREIRTSPYYRSVPSAPVYGKPFANETPEFRALMKRLGVIE